MRKLIGVGAGVLLGMLSSMPAISAAGVNVIEHAQQIDKETMKHAVDHGIWFTAQYLVFTIDIRSFTEANKAKQQIVLKDTEHFFEMVKKYKAKLTFGTDLVVGADASLQTKELVARAKWFTPLKFWYRRHHARVNWWHWRVRAIPIRASLASSRKARMPTCCWWTWGRRENVDGASGDASRLQTMVKYSW